MQLYEEWYPKYIKTIDKKTALYIRPALNRLEPLHNIRIQHLRKVDIKDLLINANTTPRNIEYMKRLITLMLSYAVESEYVGHSIQDLTEKTYTKRDLEWLKTELLKIDLMYE